MEPTVEEKEELYVHKKLDAEELIGLELSKDEFIKLICSSVQVIDLVFDAPKTNNDDPAEPESIATEWICQFCAAKNVSKNAFCDQCFVEPPKQDTTSNDDIGDNDDNDKNE
eukprot:345169_1